MSEERLQKILARSGVASRRKAEELIEEGRVTVNGAVAELGLKVDAERAAIKVDGRRIVPRRVVGRYLLLNKPARCITSRSDPEGRPTVFDLVPAGLRRGLNAVGRLDFHSEGLILLTDDGELAQRVSHPRYGCVKTYAVKVRGVPEAAAVDKLREGIVLDGRRTLPAAIELRKAADPGRGVKNSWWTVRLSEGRTRQIREMFHRIGHPVQRLRRVAIGPVTEAGLPVGGLRELTPEELRALRGERPARGAARRRRGKARGRRR